MVSQVWTGAQQSRGLLVLDAPGLDMQKAGMEFTGRANAAVPDALFPLPIRKRTALTDRADRSSGPLNPLCAGPSIP